MKFLPPELVRPHMMPLNIIYHNPLKNGGSFKDKDILEIIIKDQDTNEKFVFSIENPKIEIFIINEEYRNYSHMKDWVEIDKCTSYKVPYRTRWSEAAKHLELESGELAKASPYVFGADYPIESYYLMQFLIEYPSDSPKILSLGKLDIENDIIQVEGFPEPGEAPINAVTYINMDTKDDYTLVLMKDNLPKVSPGNPKYEEIEAMKKKFYQQVDKIMLNPGYMEKRCHEVFDEIHPGFNYNLLYYTEEVELLRDLFKIIHSTDNDYIGIWNIPYDMQNNIQRPIKLGIDPREIICDDRFPEKDIEFKEDTNPVAHKRRHICVTSTIPTFVDDMVHYAGIRSGRGVQASLKLNNVAQKELHDEKYDYSEVSDIKHLFYDDLERFILYNIKDVLLLDQLERTTKDTSTIYGRLYQMAVFPREAFTTTKVVLHSLAMFAQGKGYVLGTNRNKGQHEKKIIKYSEVLGKVIEEVSEDDEYFLEEDLLDDEEEDTEEEESGSKKEEKYDGAFVMNTLHMKPTGINIMGQPAQYVHNNVAD